MDASRRDELIARYREGSAVVEQVAAGLGDEDLNHVPADGGWSPREVIHHLADSEMTSAIRLRKLLAEDSPVIQGYDEEDWGRSGTHTESGPYSVEMWLEIYASHAHDHAEQIERSVAEARGS